MKIDTKVIHGAYKPDGETGATVAPLVMSTSFTHESAEDIEAVFNGRAPGYVYSRISNPTIMAWERRLTELEGGMATIACASGMAAISTSILALAGAGDEIVSGNSLFGGTYSLFAHTLARYGIKTVFVESTDVSAYAKAITDKTKVIFVETIGNPKMDVPDLAAIATLAKENGIVFVVDSTVTTPIMVRPKEFGADIVVHSSSKFINGHGNALGGAIVDCGTFDWSGDRYEHLHDYHAKAGSFAFMAALRNQYFRDIGACISPFNAFLTNMSVESLAVRMERHCDNALELAGRLDSDKRVEQVRYPGLAGHPGNKVAEAQFDGMYGAVLGFRLGSKERCFQFINGLNRVQNLANLGDAKTLVIHPASTICHDLSEAERQAVGVTDDLVRMSVGIENIEDIWEDVNNGLDSLK